MAITKDRVLKELQKRAAAEKAAAALPQFKINDFCFPEQLAFALERKIIKVACTSRRSGKSVSIIADFADTCLKENNVTCLYLTLTMRSARSILWGELKRVADEYKWDVNTDETRLEMFFNKTKSKIVCGGAKDESEIEKYRGWKLRKAYVDECFHPDTLVKTEYGYRPIKDIKVGDRVYNCTGLDVVTEVSKKIKHTYIELTFNNNVVKCSLEHPFFTKSGWKRASDLSIGEELVSEEASVYILRNDFSKAGPKDLQVLQQCLQWEVGQGESAKSDGEPGDCEKSLSNIEAIKTQAKSSWWKRAWANCSRIFNYAKISTVEMEPCNWVRKSYKRLSIKLQGGPSTCRTEACNRSGWGVPQSSVQKTTGQEKRGQDRFVRLEGSKIKKCSSDATNRDGVFYDIGVLKHPSFIVNDVLVHNCQSFRPYLRTLVNDILLPALRDLNGELGLTGTPGPIMAGPFFDYCHLPNIPNHHWNAFNNPHMHNPEGKFGLPAKDLHIRLAEERALKGIDESDPSYVRETYGRWIEDKDSLVFKFNASKNVYSNLPTGPMDYIFGIDIGWNDSDAIAVLGYNYTDKKVYLIEELIENKLTISDLVGKINVLKAKYQPIKMVMDSGALGKKIQEEIKQRHGLNIEAAEKHRKFEFIELLNDDLRTGKLLAYPGSRFEQDCKLVTWEKTDGGQRVISDSYHSDINDAALYAWRECKHYIGALTKLKKPARHTQEYMDMLEQEEADALERAKNSQDSVVTDDDLDYIFNT